MTRVRNSDSPLRITIVTPSYNQGAFIESTILSVLEQNYPNLEYIVMDGGSGDETLAILRRYDKYLHWTSETDGGQSDALNKAFARATGDVMAFINTDDVYEPGALARVSRHFAQRPESAWVTGKCRIIDAAGREIRRPVTWYKNNWLRLRSRGALLVLNYISQPATFWRREVLATVGPFDEKLHYAMDYDYWLRVARSYRLDVIDAYLASFRIHPGSKAGASASAQFEAGLSIAQQYSRSRIVMGLHRLHDALTVGAYRNLFAHDQTGHE